MNIFLSLPNTIPDDMPGCNVIRHITEGRKCVMWRLEEKDGRMTKVPYKPNGYKASPTNPRDWISIYNAAYTLKRGGFDGIGLVIIKDDPVTFVDIDHCIKDGKYSDIAAEFLEALGNGPDVYREYSQSGEGIHFLVMARIPEPALRDKRIDGSYKNSSLGVEVYDNARYCALTGNQF